MAFPDIPSSILTKDTIALSPGQVASGSKGSALLQGIGGGVIIPTLLPESHSDG